MEYITEKNRIYSKDSDGSIIAEVTFPEVECGIYNINHTFVDTSLRGKGVAGKLVELAIKQDNCVLFLRSELDCKIHESEGRNLNG